MAATSLAPSVSCGPRAAPTRRITVGVMGLNGRGKALAGVLAAQPDVDIAYLCDVDSRASSAPPPRASRKVSGTRRKR